MAYHQSKHMFKHILLSRYYSFTADGIERKYNCSKCLELPTGHSVSPLSNIVSLITVNGVYQKRKIGQCISEEKCSRIAFIPDENCVEDLRTAAKLTHKKRERSYVNAWLNENEEGSRQPSNMESISTRSSGLITVGMARYTHPMCLLCLALL